MIFRIKFLVLVAFNFSFGIIKNTTFTKKMINTKDQIKNGSKAKRN